MLNRSYASILLADAISCCYLHDREGNIRKPLPVGVDQNTVIKTIQQLTLTCNYTKEVFTLLVEACEEDLDFDQFMLKVFNCESIKDDSFTYTVAEDYLLTRKAIHSR